jgi:hypothetical protein
LQRRRRSSVRARGGLAVASVTDALSCILLLAPAEENKAKANPTQAAAKKEKNDAKREGRKASGSVKAFA